MHINPGPANNLPRSPAGTNTVNMFDYNEVEALSGAWHVIPLLISIAAPITTIGKSMFRLLETLNLS